MEENGNHAGQLNGRVMSRRERSGNGDAAMPAPRLEQGDAYSLIAHDMRAALTVASGFAMTLLRRGHEMDRDAVRQALEAIERNTSILMRFADDMLEMSRAETGALQLRFEEVDLRILIGDAVKRARLEHQSLRFRIHVEEEPLTVSADARRIGQVLNNLLSNAAKHAPDASDVEIVVSRVLNGAVVSVSDHGAGIPLEVRQHLFQRFPPGRDNGADAIGLGLYLSRVIVESHGGRIWAKSCPGSTTFGFMLPLT